jgi:hypothetical protein
VFRRCAAGHVGEEGTPGGRSEGEGAAVAVLAVPDEDAIGQIVGDLDAVSAAGRRTDDETVPPRPETTAPSGLAPVGHLHRALLDLVAISPNLDPVALSVRFLGWVPRGSDSQDGAWRGRASR